MDKEIIKIIIIKNVGYKEARSAWVGTNVPPPLVLGWPVSYVIN